MSKNTFTVNVDDKEITLRTLKINSMIRDESNKYYSKAFTQALSNGMPIKIQIEKELESRGLLDTKGDDEKIMDTRKKIKDLEIKLRKGVVGNRRMTKEEGRALAMDIKAERDVLGSIGVHMNELFNHSVESFAENERLQYFVYACTVHPDNGQRYWKSYESFKEDNDSEVYSSAVKNFLKVFGGIDEDAEKDLYENQWLIRMGFMDEKLRLINSQGHLVDRDGRLINEEGRFVNETGDFVDIYGNPVDVDGNLLVEDTWAEEPPPLPEPEMGFQPTT